MSQFASIEDNLAGISLSFLGSIILELEECVHNSHDDEFKKKTNGYINFLVEKYRFVKVTESRWVPKKVQ